MVINVYNCMCYLTKVGIGKKELKKDESLYAVLCICSTASLFSSMCSVNGSKCQYRYWYYLFDSYFCSY